MRLLDMIQVPEFAAYVGIVFVAGAGYRVGVVKDGKFDHYSPQAAWRLAKAEAGDAEPDDYVKALGLTAGKVRAMGLAGAEPAGHA
jgi:hypothetical protein